MNTSLKFNENLKQSILENKGIFDIQNIEEVACRLISRSDKDLINDLKKDLENLKIVSDNITKIIDNIFQILNSENITQNLIKGKDYKLSESEVRIIKLD